MASSTQAFNRSERLWPKSEWKVDKQTATKLAQILRPIFKAEIEKEHLGGEILPLLDSLYFPLAAWVANKHINSPIIIGINGAQGSGKSTLCKILSSLISTGFGKSVLQLSIDDLYLSRKKRYQLARDIHPLLETRGVPGTHDVERGIRILSRLKQKTPLDKTDKIPVFDKATDDQLAEKQWREITRSVDIILFEGWCVGAKAQDNSRLKKAVNQLEEQQDADGIWRDYINSQLAGPYKELFDLIDYQIMLKVPDMASVLEWRGLQEKKLALSCDRNALSRTKIMSEKELLRFIMHFERITAETLQTMPATADIVLQLNKDHQVCDVKFNPKRN